MIARQLLKCLLNLIIKKNYFKKEQKIWITLLKFLVISMIRRSDKMKKKIVGEREGKRVRKAIWIKEK